MNDSSSDQSDSHKPQQPLHQLLHPSMRVGSFHPQQQQQQQQQASAAIQQQQFLLSVLLLQKNLQERQKQRQQQSGQWLQPPPQWNHQLPHGFLPPAHLQRHPLPIQHPLPPSDMDQSKISSNNCSSNNKSSNNNKISNSNSNSSNSGNTNHLIPPQSAHQHNLQKKQRDVGIWAEKIASLIRSSEAPRTQRLLGLRVLSLDIERTSIDQPWGIGFVSTNHQSSYKPHANHNHNNGSSCQKHNNLSILFGRRIIVVKSPVMEKDPSARILPGDIILEIDGKPISSWSSSGNHNPKQTYSVTAEIASHLRSIQKVSIVVLRHAQALAAASRASNPSSNQQHDPYQISAIANASWNQLLLAPKQQQCLPRPKQLPPKAKPRKDFVQHANPWFWKLDEQGNKVHLPYRDNQGSLDYELYKQQEITHASLFLPPIPTARTEFCEWLSERKSRWRSRYKVYKFATEQQQHAKKKPKAKSASISSHDDENSDCTMTPNADFWTHQGFSSFEDWLRTRSVQWHRSYSWNKLKRQKIEEECFQKVVALPTCSNTNHSQQSSVCSPEEFREWLTARRVQWKMSRRKRKRQRLSFIESSNIDASPAATNDSVDSPRCVTSFPCTEGTSALGKRKLQFLSQEDQQMAYIDEILEEKEREKQELLRKRAERPPIDIIRFFDATKGIPDDVVTHCFAYLDPREHGKLLRINRAVSKSLQDRHGVWQMLCPTHWILPRRPRKPWHEIYLTRLRKEHELHQKRWDDLLIKCSSALFKRDDLQKIEKLISKAETEFGFDLNYSSGVVCERNSILNLAVIHGRYKVVRWLVDTKHADIETADRGNFTPLLNAAWSGDRWLVRFFLQRQSNRLVKGTQHYTQGIAPPGFEGKTAEGWAEHRGHPEIAKLIKLGL